MCYLLDDVLADAYADALNYWLCWGLGADVVLSGHWILYFAYHLTNKVDVHRSM